jgi:hypothetical protein
MIDFVAAWQDLHDYLVSLKDETITRKICDNIHTKFKYACSIVHEKVCRVVLEHDDYEARELNCPLYQLCAKSKEMGGHSLYCNIAGYAKLYSLSEVEALIDTIPEDSLNKLKDIKGTW